MTLALRLYAFALREGDTRLAELLHRRLVRTALATRIVTRVARRIGLSSGP